MTRPRKGVGFFMEKLAIIPPVLSNEIAINAIGISLDTQKTGEALVNKYKGKRVMLYLPDKINLVHGLLMLDPTMRTCVVLYDAKLLGPLADDGADGDHGMTKNLIHRTVVNLVRRGVREGQLEEQRNQLDDKTVKAIE